MLGPPALAGTMIAIPLYAGFWESWPTRIFLIVEIALLGILAGVFFVIGFRRVLYGGEWSCTIDDEFLTWTCPERSGGVGQKIELKNIRAFVFRVAKLVDEPTYHFFVRTDAGESEIDINCFGTLKRFLRTLLMANPRAELEVDSESRRLLWFGYDRMIGELNAQAKAWRGGASSPPHKDG
jgi:hypothetical protein